MKLPIAILTTLGLAFTISPSFAQDYGSGAPAETPSPSPTPTDSPTPTPTPTETPSPSPTPTETPSPTPSPEEPGEEASAVELLNEEFALNFIHHLNQLEIQKTQQVQGRLSSQQAEDTAQVILEDHQASEEQLVELAAQSDVQLQGFQLSTFELAAIQRLQTLSGEDLDNVYNELQTLLHEAAIQELQLIQERIDDSEIQSFISETITSLERHLELAEQGQTQTGDGNGTAQDSGQDGQTTDSGGTGGTDTETTTENGNGTTTTTVNGNGTVAGQVG